MDHRHLFGTAAIILSGAVFMHALEDANAFPSGPNVSMGSNPIDHSVVICNGSSNFTNSSSQSFVITDLIIYGSSNNLQLLIDGTMTLHTYGDRDIGMKSGIKVAPGQVVTCTGNVYRQFTISGYYTH